MTNFEKVTRSPESLAEFLRNLVAVNTPWEKKFSQLICAPCERECCDGCSSIQMSKDPLWWLGMQAEEPEAEGDEEPEKIRVIRKQPGRAPEIVEIENTLEDLQNAVGGFIEEFELTEETCILCDEEGKIKNRRYNTTVGGEIFAGDILVVGVKGEDFTSLKEPERMAESLWPAWSGKHDQE